MNAYERLYKPIIEDLTRRFDRVEAALERLLDLDLPEWAHAEVTAALFYAETTIGDRDEADAARRLRETDAPPVVDDDDVEDIAEWDSSQDDTIMPCLALSARGTLGDDFDPAEDGEATFTEDELDAMDIDELCDIAETDPRTGVVEIPAWRVRPASDDADFTPRGDHNPHVCLCDECTIWRMAGGVNWTPDSMVLARERFAEQQQAAAARAASPGQTETTRPIFGYGPHIRLAQQRLSRRTR